MQKTFYRCPSLNNFTIHDKFIDDIVYSFPSADVACQPSVVGHCCLFPQPRGGSGGTFFSANVAAGKKKFAHSKKGATFALTILLNKIVK
jgi:hypothetical protein